MKHYILVHWRQREGETCRTLVNLHKIVTVVGSLQGCKIHFQGYCLDVEDSFDDVCGMIERAEAEGSRKPGPPLMGTGDRMDLPGASAPVQCREQWEADRNGWPYCTNCGVPAAIDREEFRMKGNIRADKSPRCPTCGANMYGKDTNVPGRPGTGAQAQQAKHLANPFEFNPFFDDPGGGVTPYERTAPQAAPHERRRDPEGVPSGEGPEEAAEDPGG